MTKLQALTDHIPTDLANIVMAYCEYVPIQRTKEQYGSVLQQICEMRMIQQESNEPDRPKTYVGILRFIENHKDDGSIRYKYSPPGAVHKWRTGTDPYVFFSSEDENDYTEDEEDS